MSDSEPKSYSNALIVVLLLVIFPIGFYTYFEYRKHNDGVAIKELPYLSLDSIPQFKFIAHTGDTITRDSIIGRITVADFFFTTCPGICPRMTRQMKSLQDYLIRNTNIKGEYRLLSHTVNPAVDSIETLKAYAEEHKVNSQYWWLLTGDKEALYDISKNFYKLPAIDMSADSTLAEPFVHSERFVLLDREGFIRGYYDGTDSSSVKQLMYDFVNLDVKYAIEDSRLKKGE